MSHAGQHSALLPCNVTLASNAGFPQKIRNKIPWFFHDNSMIDFNWKILFDDDEKMVLVHRLKNEKLFFFQLLSERSEREKIERNQHLKSNLMPKFHDFLLTIKFHDFSMHGIFFQPFSMFSRAFGNPGNVTIWSHLPHAACAARSDVIKCGKRGADFFISVSSW